MGKTNEPNWPHIHKIYEMGKTNEPIPNVTKPQIVRITCE